MVSGWIVQTPYLKAPYLLQHVDEHLVSLAMHLGELDGGGHACTPRRRQKREVRVASAARHRRQLELNTPTHGALQRSGQRAGECIGGIRVRVVPLHGANEHLVD